MSSTTWTTTPSLSQTLLSRVKDWTLRRALATGMATSACVYSALGVGIRHVSSLVVPGHRSIPTAEWWNLSRFPSTHIVTSRTASTSQQSESTELAEGSQKHDGDVGAPDWAGTVVVCQTRARAIPIDGPKYKSQRNATSYPTPPCLRTTTSLAGRWTTDHAHPGTLKTAGSAG